jgi:hypothetical protein
MDLSTVEGFEWDAHNERHVLVQYPDRQLTKQELESVLDDENLLLEFVRYDAVRLTPYYFCLGVSNKGRLLKLTFELANTNLIRIFHAHPTSKPKYKALYYGR